MSGVRTSSNQRSPRHRTRRHLVSQRTQPHRLAFLVRNPLFPTPFQFEWESAEEEAREGNQRPDGVAYHETDHTVLFLEFARPMDQDQNVYAAQERKSTQYSVAEAAIRRAERQTPFLNRTVRHVDSVPFVVGVRGSVVYNRLLGALEVFKLSARKTDRVIAAGVRAAVTASSEMITARTAALPTAPRRGRQAYQVRPRQDRGWRADRGVT